MLNENVVTVETNYPKFPQIIALGPNLKNLISSYMNFVTILLIIHALITLHGFHAWNNRVSFSCGKERLVLPCSSCWRGDWRGSRWFYCRARPCIHKKILRLNSKNPILTTRIHHVLILIMHGLRCTHTMISFQLT